MAYISFFSPPFKIHSTDLVAETLDAPAHRGLAHRLDNGLVELVALLERGVEHELADL